ncbi:hypothetical protein [Pedobacter heparinus]|uniref:hypothetical protein n=1 Tax=Pedobacter heparinus TaxID=984 RepID=UPI0029307CC8|nr:hypothetical protein [Pedobacter heparinus]
MSHASSNIANKGGNKFRVNPFIKMIEDKKRIAEAIRNGKDLSKLKDINFVSPL